MIGFLRGEIAAISDPQVVIDVGGVGYNVLMPSSSIEVLPGLSNEVKVYTHLSVREDAMTLYGFLTADDLNFFKLLIGVSGVGPKFALGLLSTFTTSELRLAVMSMDAKTLTKSPGIGLKSAQKIILELKDKVSIEEVIHGPAVATREGNSGGLTEEMKDAQEALVTLGYSATESLRAIRESGASEGDDVETILKRALKAMKR